MPFICPPSPDKCSKVHFHRSGPLTRNMKIFGWLLNRISRPLSAPCLFIYDALLQSTAGANELASLPQANSQCGAAQALLLLSRLGGALMDALVLEKPPWIWPETHKRPNAQKKRQFKGNDWYCQTYCQIKRGRVLKGNWSTVLCLESIIYATHGANKTTTAW